MVRKPLRGFGRALGAWGVLTCLSAAPAAGQTVDGILAANLRARGGQAVIDAVHSVRQTMTLDMQGGEATVVVMAQRPDSIRQEMTLGGETVINAWDGSVAWQVNPWIGLTAPTPMTGEPADALREQASFNGPLQALRAAGHRIALVGIEDRAGRAVYHLRISTDDGHWVRHCYVDRETALESALVTQSEVGWFEQAFEDYRDVQGLRVPFVIRTALNGRPQSELTVTEVALNVPIDATLFSPPGARP